MSQRRFDGGRLNRACVYALQGSCSAREMIRTPHRPRYQSARTRLLVGDGRCEVVLRSACFRRQLGCFSTDQEALPEVAATGATSRWAAVKISTTQKLQVLDQDEPRMNPTRRAGHFALQFAKVAACIHLVTQYVFTIRLTYGPSMLPTLDIRGDWVFLSKLQVRGRGVKVGDIVSFAHPMFPDTSALKRVVGMPGDFVLRDSPGSDSNTMLQVIHLHAPRLAYMDRQLTLAQVPKGHCWVIGDDLGNSRDSRVFGPLPLALIKGRALFRIRAARPWVTTLDNGLQKPSGGV